MYNLVITCSTHSHTGNYASVQDCMTVVDMWEDTYANVQWNITKITRQRGQYSPRQNKINKHR